MNKYIVGIPESQYVEDGFYYLIGSESLDSIEAFRASASEYFREPKYAKRYTLAEAMEMVEKLVPLFGRVEICNADPDAPESFLDTYGVP